MKQNESSLDQTQKLLEATWPCKVGDPLPGEGGAAPLPNEAAAARPLGGIERETQMDLGSSLFDAGR
jgi:hypothetical protein